MNYLRIGDLVKLTNGNSIGYVVLDTDPPKQFGEELKHNCCIRWIDGDLKTEGWISLGSVLKEGRTDTLTLITDEKQKKFYTDRYPFVNTLRGTRNILNSDFPPIKNHEQ